MPDYDRGRGLWKRLLLGGLLIVAAAAAATSVAAFNEVNRVVGAFRHNPSLDLGNDLALADAGKPQTIMLIGSDRRSKTAVDFDPHARSDTIILMRLDPSKQATALLSLPRDLKVQIPGHGVAKINEAYSDGGAKLTLETVKRLTGLRINHVINVDFKGFATGVDRLGCVYMDIDRRYLNQTQSYATIDVKPGYQKLCGGDALDFVRFRHEDNDIVRAARQQEFLSQAKQQFGIGKLIGTRVKLIDIFGQYTRSDIRSRTAVLRIIKLAIASASHPVQEVHFEGHIGPSFVTASASTVRKLAREFLGVKKSRPSAAKPRRKKRRKKLKTPAALNLADISGNSRQQALQAVTGGAKMRIFYPRLGNRSAQFAGPARVYGIRSRTGTVYNAYRMVVSYGLVGQYWGVQGMTWKTPPILKHPSETRKIHGRTFKLFYEGNKLRLLSWETRDAVYWVANTLSQQLSNDQMVSIAASTRTL